VTCIVIKTKLKKKSPKKTILDLRFAQEEEKQTIIGLIWKYARQPEFIYKSMVKENLNRIQLHNKSGNYGYTAFLE
jgi:hypothetical protein